jgi:gamma-glutamylcyclotransferase (GGCT)/AIG2-like uncharacterized protein YtfP
MTLVKAGSKNEFLGVYGTLRRRSLFQRGPSISPKLRFFCFGHLRGSLFCHRSFPAVVPGPGIVPVEVFLVLDPTVWDELDRYEGCLLADEPSSPFYRQRVRLLRPALSVWVYFLGHRQVRGNLVDSLAPRTNRVTFSHQNSVKGQSDDYGRAYSRT